MKTLNKFELSILLTFEIKYINLYQAPEEKPGKSQTVGRGFSGILRENAYLWLWPSSQGLKTFIDVSILNQLA